METPKTLLEAINFFSDYENCRQFMISVRWADGVVRCPYCNATKLTYLAKARVYRCYGKHLKQKFSLKVGTIFEDSAIGLEKWLPASWLISNCKNGISSYELARALGVTQKSAWHMLHRLRFAMTDTKGGKIGGSGVPVEVDETFVGVKVRNMHKSKQPKTWLSHGGGGKAIVMGMLERGGKVRAQTITSRKRDDLDPVLASHVEVGANIITDELTAYGFLKTPYAREVINHSVAYVNGHIHTNGIENFWSLLKRGLSGTYISVEPFHLDAYIAEQVFRYNNRKDMNDAGRFTQCLSQTTGKRLTYADLIAKGERQA
jgi:hypothetical protein